MYVVSVTIFVNPEFRQQFIEATYANAAGTRLESGNVRFDVLQAEEDPDRFMLYEVYVTKDDFTRHQQTAHYATWKNAVSEWMAKPRQAVRLSPLFFGESKVQGQK